MKRVPQGGIFNGPSEGETVPFSQAFPEIADVSVEVSEYGEGNQGLGVRRFQRTTVREYVNCSNHNCAGKGFSLGKLLRQASAAHQTEAKVRQTCESHDEAGRPCPNVFDVAVQLRYKASDPRDATSPFGVLAFLPWDHDWNRHHFAPEAVDRAATLMREAGVSIVRLDFLWSDLEPAERRFDFARYDRIIDTLWKNDLRVTGVLQYNPSWRNVSWNRVPDTDAYLRYGEAVVRHFKERVRYWEVWNEPDHPTYWQPQDGLVGYAALLKRVYSVLKSADPTCRVLMAGLSQEWTANLRRIYELAGRESFDIVNIHPFMSPLQPDALGTLKKSHGEILDLMKSAGDADKPIWFTEIGCPGVPGGMPMKEWWLGKNPTEAEQAEWVQNVYQHIPRWENVDQVMWAFFRDTDAHFNDAVDYLGLVRLDFSLKPAYHAFQRMADAYRKNPER